MRQPDPSGILNRLAIEDPLIGLYDAPDPSPFQPLVPAGKRRCVFAFMRSWREGKTLHLTRHDYPQCGGSHLVGKDVRSREEMVDFLCGEEGLRASAELMHLWLDSVRDYEMVHPHLLFGPLLPDQYDYLRTVTFFVNPDQLAVLSAGASYFNKPGDPPPVLAPYGAGCMQLAALFDDLDTPQAIIGGTDHAMRTHLEPCTLAFTVTKPMFELLCQWASDPKSSLHTTFLDDLIRSRGGSLSSAASRRTPPLK